MPIHVLKRRSEFLRLRGGLRYATSAFVLEAKSRPNATRGDNARFGFTVSKRIGGAVVRNRVRRRLKAAVAELTTQHAEPGFDYVLIARAPAFERPFALLKKDLVRAFTSIRTQAKGARET